MRSDRIRIRNLDREVLEYFRNINQKITFDSLDASIVTEIKNGEGTNKYNDAELRSRIISLENKKLAAADAENIYANEEGWLSNSEETVIAADPDVTITSVKYDGYDFNEISARPGWENISAVKNGCVYEVEPNPVSRPSQNVVKGIREVAAAVYPEIFGE